MDRQVHAHTQAYTYTHFDCEPENKSQQGAENCQITLSPAGGQAQVQTLSFHDWNNHHGQQSWHLYSLMLQWEKKILHLSNVTETNKQWHTLENVWTYREGHPSTPAYPSSDPCPQQNWLTPYSKAVRGMCLYTAALIWLWTRVQWDFKCYCKSKKKKK